jgi:hypothetical protein
MGLRNQVLSARILGAPDATVGIQQEKDAVSLTLPAEAPEAHISVVALDLDGSPEVEQMIIQDRNKAIILPMHVANLKGDMTVAGDGVAKGWTDTESSAAWCFRLQSPGTYVAAVEVRVDKLTPEPILRHELQLEIGDEKIHSTITVEEADASESAERFQLKCCPIGQLTIDVSGEHVLRVSATKIDENTEAGLRLVAVELTPSQTNPVIP